MVHCEEEAGDFARIASALSVNLGTLSPAWVAGMKKAVEQTRAMNKPWVLDPVGMGATPYRSRCTAERARMKPTVIRGNASEIKSLYAALGGHSAVAGKGVDSAHSTDAALHDAVALARHLECVVACTGHVDYITDGARVVATRNGHPLMTKVTAVGCSLSSGADALPWRASRTHRPRIPSNCLRPCPRSGGGVRRCVSCGPADGHRPRHLRLQRGGGRRGPGRAGAGHLSGAVHG